MGAEGRASVPTGRGGAGASAPIALFVPGIFSSSAYFDLPGRREPSLADAFRARGCAVELFDPLGVGSRRVANDVLARVDFAARVDDLGARVGALREAARGGLVLVGHSFGGTTIGGLLARAARGRSELPARDVAVVTIGSPFLLDARRPRPWERLFSREADVLVGEFARDGVIELHQFLAAQARISTRVIDHGFAAPGAIAWALRLAARSPSVAALLLAGPRLPATFLYGRRDFDARAFHRFLATPVLERESARLVRQLLGWGSGDGRVVLDDAGGPIDVAAEVARLELPMLAIASDADQLVRPHEVEALHGPRVEHARIEGSGHGGYLYGFRAATLAHVERFLDRLAWLRR